MTLLESPVHTLSKKLKETNTRVKTAVVGGSVFLLLVLRGGPVGASFAAAFLASAMCWELSQIIFHLSDRVEKKFALVGTAWLVLFVNMILHRYLLGCLILAVLGFFTYFLLIADRHAHHLHQHFLELVCCIFVLIYTALFMAFLPLIRGEVNGTYWVLLFLLIIWVGDTAAYFAGRKYGGKRLYPLISPGKTVVGAVVGLAAGVIVAVFFQLLFFHALGFFSAVFIALIVGVSSQIGDLCESLLKRAFGLKDISQMLPGHGGVLDRFDGILFSLPVMFFCIQIFT